MANELSTRTNQFDLSPQSFEQALTFAKYMAESDMVPKNFRGKTGDCLVAMQWGFEVGLKPLQALQNIAVINGKPGIYGDAGKAILLAAGCSIDEDDMQVVQKNGRARCKITRPGRAPVERTFSLEDAKTAGLWNKEGPWRNYPYRQMAWRAFWFAARDAASDLLKGMNSAEELADAPAEKHMGAAHIVEPEQSPATYPSDQFAKNLPAWRGVMAKGRKTADEIIAMAQTKFPLTDEQKAEIRKAPEPEISVTYAALADQILKATNADALAEAGDLIGSVASPEQRVELTALYEKRGAELAAGAPA